MSRQGANKKASRKVSWIVPAVYVQLAIVLLNGAARLLTTAA